MVSPVVAKICILFIILIDGKVVLYKVLNRSEYERGGNFEVFQLQKRPRVNPQSRNNASIMLDSLMLGLYYASPKWFLLEPFIADLL